MQEKVKKNFFVTKKRWRHKKKLATQNSATSLQKRILQFLTKTYIYLKIKIRAKNCLNIYLNMNKTYFSFNSIKVVVLH